MTTEKVLRFCRIFILLTISLEIVLVHPHVVFWWHSLIGVDALFGFVGCLFMVWLVKGPLFDLIRRDEDYYNASGGEKHHD
jgi:hypothetical protein